MTWQWQGGDGSCRRGERPLPSRYALWIRIISLSTGVRWGSRGFLQNSAVQPFSMLFDDGLPVTVPADDEGIAQRMGSIDGDPNGIGVSQVAGLSG